MPCPTSRLKQRHRGRGASAVGETGRSCRETRAEVLRSWEDGIRPSQPLVGEKTLILVGFGNVSLRATDSSLRGTSFLAAFRC